MERALFNYLKNWLVAVDRKPLVIRGPRQVGKTWLVRYLAKFYKKQLIELNFEKDPSYASFFTSNDPKSILLNLSTLTKEKIEPENCILFLDEIQMAPQLLAKLRWFFEDLPQLAVVAAGSLLEFVLFQHSFSMPVGRISYAHLEPLSFEEFLIANGKESLYRYLSEYDFIMDFPAVLHEQLTRLFKEYVFVGGLPEVVLSWSTERSLGKVSQLHHDLLSTYHDDFSKYQGRIVTARLAEVLMAIPKMLGQKFVFSRVNPLIQAPTIKQVLTLLEKARICHRVKSIAANGVPLAGEIKEKYFKEIFLDVGLCNSALGFSFKQINAIADIVLVNHGAIAEQVVGQILRTIESPYIEPALYCWHREESGSNAEIDYVIQHGNQVIPLEVKAGSTGSLKSLHLFMGLKQLPLAIRINSALPSKTKVAVKNHQRHPTHYTLLSIPFYLIGQIHRLLDLT
jgi:predicted AAA+ superfamily ATPase